MKSKERTSPHLLVRKARPDDMGIIISNNLAMAKETEGRDLEREAASNGVKGMIEDPRKGIYILAEVSGRVVGQCMITYEWSDWRNGDFWWLQSVYVIPEFRAQGIFGLIYEHVLAEARERSDVVGLRLYVEKGNRVAQDVYEHLGIKRSHYDMYEIDLTKK